MKLLKILYYISLSICLVQLLGILFGPFGGPMTIFSMIKEGNNTVTLENHRVIYLDYSPYIDNPAAKYLHIFSSIIRFIYFSSLLICSSLPLFYKMDLKRKYQTGIIFCIIATMGAIVLNMIWRHLVKVYLGV